MKKRIAILANHSGGLYDFRKDLISELKKHANVTVAVPHNDRWEELHKLVDEVIELPVDRRGMNPIHDSKLFRQYRAMLKEVKPDLVRGSFFLRMPGIGTPSLPPALCRRGATWCSTARASI